jgi:hypothetical protein
MPTSHRTFTPRIAIAIAIALTAGAASGCGSKTGLFPWDARPESGFDASEDRPDVIDVSDAPDVSDVPVCVPGQFSLDRRGAEIMLVIDRSNSMAFSLDGTPAPMGEPNRWQVLTSALNTLLPRFEATVSFGAKFYPQPVDPGEPDLMANCRTLPGVELAPALNNARALLRFFTITRPGGGTPTFDGLTEAMTYLRARPNRGSARYIVLATDGGPNCNAANPSSPSTCVCTSSDVNACRNNPRIGIYNCLDAARTIARIQEIASPTTPDTQAIPVYVVGMDGSMTTRADLLAVLDDMAVAGGRPRPRATPTDRAYYSVRNPADLSNAFQSIVAPLARCAYVTPTRPTNADDIDIVLDGAPVRRDTARAEGWDWTDREFGEITFFGAACERAAAASARVTARVGCRDL